MRNDVPRSLVALFAACLGFIVLYATLSSVLNAAGKQTYSDQALQEEHVRIMQYVGGPLFSESSLVFLTPAEQSHMSDVKRLFDIAEILFLGSLGVILGVVIVLAYNKLWERLDELLARSLRALGWTLLAMMLVFGLASLLDFTKLWILLHAILFPQGNWAFPLGSVLITLYPQEFFFRLVVRFVLLLGSFALLAVALSYLMERMRVAEHEFRRRAR